MSQIQEIKQASDIIQVIGERLTLQRSGGSWRGLCPFHSEKSPSFFVSDQMQRYKCFGCNEMGDVFTFLQKYEGMTFAETLQYLADRAGITLTTNAFSPEDAQRKKVLEILDLTKEYYHYLLTQHEVGEKAREYLKKRGTTAESIKIFQIGYALPSWDSLLKYLHQKKKYSLADILAAGLIIQNSTGKTYDRFRDRIMFPLTDHRGRVVGFSGRVLDAEAKEAKYINSPETMVYHKSQMLYGFSQLYQHIRKENEVVVVEGEFDVISSAQAHINHVVAVKGSVLTEDHMKLLHRTVQKVILSFDMDKAGIAATKRAIEVAKPFGIELRVIDFSTLENGEDFKKDPDELARAQPKTWRQAIKSSISVYEFFLRAALKKHDASTPEGKRYIIDELAPVFNQITHAVELDYYIGKLAESLQVKPATVKSDLDRVKNARRMGRSSSASPNSTRRSSSTDSSSQTGAVPSGSINSAPKNVPETRKSRLEEYVLFLLFQTPPEAVKERAEKIKHVAFSQLGNQVGAKQIVTELNNYLAAGKTYSPEEFSRTLAEDLQQRLFDLTYNSQYVEMLPNIDAQKEWDKSVRELISMDISEEIQDITKHLDTLENATEKTPESEAQQTALLQKIVRLRAKQQQVKKEE